MPEPIQVTVVSNIRDVRGRFVKMRDGLEGHARDLVRETGRIRVDELSKHAPVGKHYLWDGTEYEPEHRLRDSFFFRTYVRPPQLWCRVYTTSYWPYRWTTEGTKDRAEPIRPVRAPALVFWWQKLGQTMYLKSVRHKGIEASDWADRAREAADRRTGNLLQRAGRVIVEGTGVVKEG